MENTMKAKQKQRQRSSRASIASSANRELKKQIGFYLSQKDEEIMRNRVVRPAPIAEQRLFSPANMNSTQSLYFKQAAPQQRQQTGSDIVQFRDRFGSNIYGSAVATGHRFQALQDKLVYSQSSRHSQAAAKDKIQDKFDRFCCNRSQERSLKARSRRVTKSRGSRNLE